MVKRSFEVFLPEAVLANKASGTLYGYAHEKTGVFNVLSCGQEPVAFESFAPPRVLGELHSRRPDPLPSPKGPLLAFHSPHGIEVVVEDAPCKISFYSLVQDVFSRNSGILETAFMLGTGVVISGCGSVGSLLALELARAGVGRFLLIDNDVFGYSNVCRHQCGITEVGRLKVDAVRERILAINPTASVEAVPQVVERVPKELFDRWCGPGTLVLACADNREADRYANKMSCFYKAPFISIGLWERAFAGEVFWNIPGRGDACYYCLAAPHAETLSGRVSENRRVYTTQAGLEAVKFEPGISVDIAFVTYIGAKVALELLQRGKAGARSCLLDSLTQFTLVCNTNDPELGGVMAEIFDHPLQVTRSIKLNRLPGCPHCKLADDSSN